MARQCLSFLLIALVLGSQAIAQEGGADPWSPLRFKTGWIRLGAVDVRQYDDMLVEQPHVLRVDSLEIHRFRLPRLNDHVEVVVPEQLLIRDFARFRERRRLVPPVRAAASSGDETGVVLPVGTKLKIVALVRETPTETGLQMVLARVVPAP